MKEKVIQGLISTFLVIINYILIIVFLNLLYLIYFILLFFLCCLIYKSSFSVEKNILFIYLFLFIISVFLTEYFDLYIFDIYLFLDLEKFYTYIGGSIAYILAILHSIIFFFTAFKKS